MCGSLDHLSPYLHDPRWDELSYIIDTFPIVRRKDEARWGEYRTKRMVLAQFDKLSDVSL